ncbi:MAG: C39 family peptidase [Bacilli bacterium]|nr:C39 family peptidase [Bacilli bacterium]
MVSSGQVLADLDSFNQTSTNIYNQISSLDGVWKGMSKDRQVVNAEDTLAYHKDTISEQLSSLVDALNLYEKYQQIKNNIDFYYTEYNNAVNNSDATLVSYYTSEINKQHELLNSQKKEINNILAAINASVLPDAQPLSLVRFSRKGDFVNYYQYNYQESYGYGTTIASSGCGPTAMAMVLTALTGEEVTPVEAANWSMEHGHRIKDNGTAWAYFEDIADAYGVECEQMGVSRDNIINNLSEGKYVIAVVGPGHFTKGGHYIVLTGITEDGKITVADPNSETRSQQTWDVNIFLNEGRQLWAI